MNWDSPAEFLAMGGHAAFVWGSYGVFLLLCAWEVWATARRRREAMHQAQQSLRAQQQAQGEGVA